MSKAQEMKKIADEKSSSKENLAKKMREIAKQKEKDENQKQEKIKEILKKKKGYFLSNMKRGTKKEVNKIWDEIFIKIEGLAKCGRYSYSYCFGITNIPLEYFVEKKIEELLDEIIKSFAHKTNSPELTPENLLTAFERKENKEKFRNYLYPLIKVNVVIKNIRHEGFETKIMQKQPTNTNDRHGEICVEIQW